MLTEFKRFQRRLGIDNLLYWLDSLRQDKHFLYSFSTVFLLIVIWILVTSLGWADELFLPGPVKVWQSFVSVSVDGYQGSTLITHVLTSLWRILVAFLLSCLVGIPLGILMGASRTARSFLNPLIEFYRPLPPLGLYTLLVMWLGIGEESKLALLFLAGLPGMIIATIQSIESIDQSYICVAKALGACKRVLLFHVYLPVAGPTILAGMRISGFVYTVLVAAEIVAATAGIGWMIWDASKFLLSDVVIMGPIVLGPTGACLDLIMRFIGRLVMPWTRHSELYAYSRQFYTTSFIMFTSMLSSVFSARCASVLGSSLALSAKASEKPKEITVGYLNLVNAQLVTKNLGLISKEMPGVKINYIKVGGGGDMLRAIAAKQVDFGGLGNPPTAIGVTRGLPIQDYGLKHAG